MKIFTRIKFLLLSLFVLAGVSSALAQVVVTQPTGGQNISNDLSYLATGTPAPSPAYTAIGNIVIAETAPGDFVAGANRTLWLDRPSTAWRFNAGVGTAIGNGPNISIVSTVVSASRITVTYTVTGPTTGTNSITISGIEVQSTIRTLGTEAFIFRRGGTGGINNLVAGTSPATGANVAPLSKVAGSAASLQVLYPGQSNAPGTIGRSGTASAQTAGVPFNVTVHAVDYAYNIVTAAPSQSIALSSNNAYPSFPAAQNLASGTTVFNNVVLKTSGTGNTITATDVTDGSIPQGTSTALTFAADAFTKLLTLFPGETLDPGSATGKTGTPDAPTAGVNYAVRVYSTDDNWNRVGSTNTVQMSATGVTNFTAPVPASLTSNANGRTFNLVFRVAGETPNITATNTTVPMTYTQFVPSVLVGGFARLQILLPGETAEPGTTTGKSGGPTAQVAGIPFTVRVRAVDAAWNLITGITDDISLATTDANAGPIGNQLMEADGEVEFTVTLVTGGNRRITASNVTDPSKTADTSPNVMVNAGAYAKLLVILPGEALAPGTASGKTGTPTPINAGAQVAASVFAVDAYNNRVAGNSDVIAITSNDASATLPTSAVLPVSGTRNFNITLRTAGTMTVTANNTTNGSILAGSSDIAVIGGVFTKLQVLLPGEIADPGSATGKTGSPTAQVAGIPFTVRVRAVDGAWNLITGITDDINLATTDANVSPIGNQLMETDGEVEFTVTLVTGGNKTITASNVTDPSKTANTSPNVMVSAGAYAKLLVRLPGETLAPGTATGKTGTPTAINAGAQVAASVFAVDAYNNRVAGNSDIIAITSNDASATLPASAALPVSGTRNFNITLRTPGTITVTASNTINVGIATGSSDIGVIGGVFTKLQVLLPGETADPGSATGKSGSPTAQVAGVPFTVRVRAVDGAWNLITGVTDDISLATTDANASPIGNQLMEADGEVEFTVTLITGGNRTVTASNVTDPSKTANTSAAVAIGANVFAQLQILLPGETAAPGTASGKTGSPTDRSSGTAFNATVNAVDAYWNRVAVSPTIAITTTDGNATLPVNAALSATGTRNFSVTLRTLGNATITATDVPQTFGPVVSSNVNVVQGSFAKLQLLLPGETAAPGTLTGKVGTPTPQVAGVPFDVTVNAVDAAWNKIDDVTDIVSFTASTNDIYAQVPASTALNNGTLTTQATYRVVSTTANRTLRVNDVTDGTKTGNTSSGFAVNLGPFTRLLILLPGETFAAAHPNGKTGTPANQGVGAPFTITVRATDAAFNAVGGVTDVVEITSSDAGATLPASKALVNSSTTFNVTMNTESTSNTLTASDLTDIAKTPYTTAGIPVYLPSLNTDFFRSNVAIGNWNNSSSWQSSADGLNNWKPSTLFPDAASAGVRVRNGHVISVTAALSIDDTTIENGGQLTLTTGNLTIMNGAAATDFIVEGTLRANNSRTIATTGALQFASTGKYQHAYTTGSGTIPTANWVTGSTCEIVGYTTYAGDIAGSNQAFSDFVWNAPQSAAGSPSLLSGFSARNFTVTRTNSGTLNLGSVGGTTVITGNYVQTAGNVRANKTSGTQAISFGGDFTVNGGTFALGSGTVNVTYNGSSQSLSNAGTAIEFGNVTFTSGGTKTLTSGNFNLATTGVLTMGASTTLNANGNLTLLSNASSSGTIAAIPSSSSITGNVTVQRFVTGGAVNPYRTYRMFSSPTHSGSNTYNIAQLTDDILITGKAVNGFDEIGSSATSAWFYDPTAAGTAADPGFKVFPNTSTPVLAGRGIYLLYRGDRTSNLTAKFTAPSYSPPESVVMDFTGILNQQDITVPLGYSSGISGFNLVGNPYASSIDWNAVVNSGATSDLEDNVVQVWNPALRQYATYDGNGGSANNGSRYIAAGQGFFVRSKVGGGSLTFTEGHKVGNMPPFRLMSAPLHIEAPTSSAIGKIASSNNTNVANAPQTELRTWLKKENTPYMVESVVVFKDGKSANYIPKEDVPYLKGSEVYMSTLTNDNQQMVINYMPAVTASTVVKLDLDPLNKAGNYILEVNYSNVPSGYLVKLTDNHLQTANFVSNGAQHNFIIDKNDPATFGANRFSVSFEAPNTLPVTYSSFTVAKVNEGVQVKWSTATETNNDRFEVERAGDDKVFEKLKTEYAKGSGSAYSYIDRNPILGNNYYRLVQYDKDSKSSTTDPQVVNFTGGLSNATELVSIFPNPVVSKFTVKFNGVLKANQQTLKIVSATGQVLLTKEFSKTQLLSGQDIDISGFASGVYIVEVYENGAQRVGQMKLIKQ